MARESAGKPVAEVKRRFASDWKRATDASISDPDLTASAETLFKGQRITLG